MKGFFVKHLFVPIFFAFCMNVVAYNLVIGTNTFHYAFEDASLSTQQQHRILLDLEVMQRPWINQVRCYNVTHEQSNSAGKIVFQNIISWPILFDEIDFVNFNFRTNGLNYSEILLSKKQTDVYTNCFTFIDNHLDAWNEVLTILSHLSENTFTNYPIGYLKNFIYVQDENDDYFISHHMEYVDDLLSQNYHMPNMLGIGERPSGFLNYPTNALWLALPISDKIESNQQDEVFHDVIYCVWRNGHWYLWSTAWID